MLYVWDGLLVIWLEPMTCERAGDLGGSMTYYTRIEFRIQSAVFR